MNWDVISILINSMARHYDCKLKWQGKKADELQALITFCNLFVTANIS